jgi:uncharacterized membrane protein YciS (DUF1049 family)
MVMESDPLILALVVDFDAVVVLVAVGASGDQVVAAERLFKGQFGLVNLVYED